MIPVTEDAVVMYADKRAIVRHHGLLVATGFFVVRVVLDKISVTYWWLRVAHSRFLSRYSEDRDSGKTVAWWQDIGVLLHLCLTTGVCVWSAHADRSLPFAWFASCYLLLDIVLYHTGVLWFDDLVPGRPHSRSKVTSHRRILFQALTNFAESVVLFGSLYRPFCAPDLVSAAPYQFSFDIATSLGSSRNTITPPDWLVDGQVAFSLFILVVVVSIVAAAGYVREELAPSKPEHASDRPPRDGMPPSARKPRRG